MSPSFLDKIKERLAAATPGPWEWSIRPKRHMLIHRFSERGHLTVLETEGDSEHAEYPCANEADRAFIQHAPSDIAALIAEVEQLRARAEKAEANYAFMVERAADQHLDGYRELGARAAAAENEADRLRARLREVAQVLIAEVGASGPMDAEEAARKAVERMVNLRALADEKAAEAGLYARRMEQAQQSRNEERAAVVAWLRHGRWVEKSVHMRHEYDTPVSSAIHDAADIIERGEHRREEKP